MSGPALAPAVRCLALDDLAARTHRALRDRGVVSVLLKGAGLARRLGLADRRYVDVDLLVAPADFTAAQDTLAALGHRPLLGDVRQDDWSHWHERAWVAPGPLALAIDLHRGFAGVGDPERLWRLVLASAEPVEVAGERVLVPGPACAALFVALHAANPGRSTATFDADSTQPRATADLVRALEKFPGQVWREAAGIAAATGALGAYALGLGLVPAGRAVAAELDLPRDWSPVQWISAHRGSGTAWSMARLAAEPTLRRRMRLLALRLLPSPAAMRFASPLARRGPGGLALAYALRLVRHGRRLPGALVELRRARRSGRGWPDAD